MVFSGPAVFSTEDLIHIVGEHYVRRATAEDAIDGVAPHWLVEPGSIEEVAAILKLANDTRCGVAIRGGGTKMTVGNRPHNLGLILSTTRMNRILEHAAGDLVVRVQAGARLRDVQAALTPSGQWLALDPPEPDATIGGIIATNASGSRRLRYGTVRDLLIGITYVLPDGTIAKAGGKVVKNVAGYDLCKLFTGSLGTLGLIAEAIFRLHPLPAATRSVLRMRKGTSIQDLSDAAQAISHSSLVPTALDFNWWHANSVLAIRFDGVPSGVDAQVEEAVRILEPLGGASFSTDLGASAWDSPGRFISANSPDGTYMKVSHLPTDLPRVVDDVVASLGERSLGCHIHGHAANGITVIDLFGDAAIQIDVIEELRARTTRRGESLVITQTSPAIKRHLDVWGDPGETLPLMRRVKELFDPQGIMNPGRYIGRL